jgi:hypothetical protein
MILFDYYNFPFRYTKPYKYMYILCNHGDVVLDEAITLFPCSIKENGAFQVSSTYVLSYMVFEDDNEIYGL